LGFAWHCGQEGSFADFSGVGGVLARHICRRYNFESLF
jgi:hypothetical protein